MRRARVIGEIVLGSRGIGLKPIAVPTDSPAQSWEKESSTGCRAVLWLTTGQTGLVNRPKIQKEDGHRRG